MKMATLMDTLNALPPRTDLILGDLNAQLGVQCRPRDRERADAISLWCAHRDIGLRTPETEIWSTHIDHILARPHIQAKEYHVLKATVNTDHPLLTIDCLQNVTTKPKHTPRFNIHKLENLDKAAEFINIVETLASTDREWLSHMVRDINHEPTITG